VVSLRLPEATDAVIKFANQALEIDKDSHKALFCKAKVGQKCFIYVSAVG